MALLHDSRTCARVVVVDVLQCDFSGMLVRWTSPALTTARLAGSAPAAGTLVTIKLTGMFMGTSTIMRMRLSTATRIALGC